MDVFPTSVRLVSAWCPPGVHLVSTWCPGPEPHLGRTGRGNPSLKASLARPPPQPHAPTPRRALPGALPDASVSRKARWRSLGQFWSPSGSCWPTPPASTTLSDRSSTTTASDPNAISATTPQTRDTRLHRHTQPGSLSTGPLNRLSSFSYQARVPWHRARPEIRSG